MYKFAIIISGLSSFLGIIREILIVYFLGFSSLNDQLQIYLSIFYIASLSFDAMKLSALNLFDSLTLSKILIASTIVIIPFVTIITIVLATSIEHINYLLLAECFLGAILNLIAVLFITYKQRCGKFLAPQIINILPNFVLIPCLLISYYLFKDNLIGLFIFSCFILPVIQIIMLCCVKTEKHLPHTPITLGNAIKVFLRHGFSSIPAQIFQLLIRSTFYHYGPGYLSIVSLFNRIYASSRFVLIDSYIGIKIASEYQRNSRIDNLLLNNKLNFLSVFIPFPVIILFVLNSQKTFFEIAMCAIFMVGFYLDSLWRITYFKINKVHHDKNLIYKFTLYELFFALFGYFIIISIFNNPVWYLWLWFIARPFCEMLMMQKKNIEIDRLVKYSRDSSK
jgi:hypothetical protein